MFDRARVCCRHAGHRLALDGKRSGRITLLRTYIGKFALEDQRESGSDAAYER